MKTIKTLFAVLFLSTFFIACEADALNEETEYQEIQNLNKEDDEGQTSPDNLSKTDNGSNAFTMEDDEGQTSPDNINKNQSDQNDKIYMGEDDEGQTSPDE